MATAITNGNAITINANNVTLDLNGFKLDGQAAGAKTLTNGIYSLNHKDVTLKNGTIRGFLYGVLLSDSSPGHTGSGNHMIENLRVEGNMAVGLSASGRGNVLRNNQVTDTGGSAYTEDYNGAYGIAVSGPGAHVLNNDIVGAAVPAAGWASGVMASDATGVVIENNRISDLKTATGGSIRAIHVMQSIGGTIRSNAINNAAPAENSNGIYLFASNNLNVRDNSISNMATGINFSGSTGIYMLNSVVSATTPYMGGTPGVANAQ